MIENAKSSRLSFRRWLFAAALGSVALTAQANLSLVNYNGFEVRQSGNTWTFSHEPPSSTALRGGTVLSNAGVSSSKPALIASKNLTVGKGLPVDVVAKIPPAKLAKAMLGLAKITTPIGAAVTAVELLDYFKDIGIDDVKNTPAGLVAGALPANTGISDGYEYKTIYTGWTPSPASACQATLAILFSQPQFWAVKNIIYSGPIASACSFEANYPWGGKEEATFDLQNRRSSTCSPGDYVTPDGCTSEKPVAQMSEQELLDKMASDSGWPSSAARAVQSAINKGVPVETDTPSVSGPANILGEKTTTTESVRLSPGTNTPAAPGATNTDSGTKTTTKTQSHKAEYSGNSVSTTTTTNTVTNITNNVTNVTTTEISTEVKEDDEKPDICEKNPDALMCQKIDLDTPEGDIPKTEKRVDFIPDDSFGTGYCPSDKYQTIKGQSLLIVDWAQNCDAISKWVKPIVITLSIFMAFMIVSGASRE